MRKIIKQQSKDLYVLLPASIDACMSHIEDCLLLLAGTGRPVYLIDHNINARCGMPLKAEVDYPILGKQVTGIPSGNLEASIIMDCVEEINGSTTMSLGNWGKNTCGVLKASVKTARAYDAVYRVISTTEGILSMLKCYSNTIPTELPTVTDNFPEHQFTSAYLSNNWVIVAVPIDAYEQVLIEEEEAR